MNSIEIEYQKGTQIMADKESVFALKEAGALPYLTKAKTDKRAHYQLMSYLAEGTFNVKRDEEGLHITYQSKKNTIKEKSTIIESTKESTIELLAQANELNLTDAKKAYKLARGDYEGATKILELAKGYHIEAKRIPKIISRPEPKVEYCMRKSRTLIEEWADPEIIADNVLQSTNAKDAFGKQLLEERIY